MTGLKDSYKSGEENNLDKTGQVGMEINMVTNPVQNAPVIYAATKPYSVWDTNIHSRV